MSHPTAPRSSRHPHRFTAVSPVQGWFARLATLAVVAALGCGVDKTDLGGVEDDTSGATTAGDPTDPTTAGDDTSDLTVPGEDPIATECEMQFTCACEHDRFVDVASCEAFYRVEWAGIEASAAAAGLTADLECYLSWMPYSTYACDSYTEYYGQNGPHECSFCQYAFGDQQVGEPCQTFTGGMSGCAQGLLCYPPAVGANPVCIAPCSQAGAGESCSYLSCAEGLTCDWTDMICRPTGGEGEACAESLCDPGLVCNWQTNICSKGVESGESCQTEPCAVPLVCVDGQVCTPPAGFGESCAALPCAPELACKYDDSTCAAPGGPGDSCANIECAAGYFCDWNAQICGAPGQIGDSCVDRPCVDGLRCDDQTMMLCAAFPAVGEPCNGQCAGELLCNFEVFPAICAALPLEGEPCLQGACAAALFCHPDTMLCTVEPPVLCGL